MSRVTLNLRGYCLRPIDRPTLYVKTSLFTASLFTFKSFIHFVHNDDFYQNSFCAFLAMVKTYTQTKNYTCVFTGSHLRAVTDNDDDDNDADNAGRHTTITRLQ